MKHISSAMATTTTVTTMTHDPLTPPFEQGGRRPSSPILPCDTFESLNLASTRSRPIILSPPPTPRTPRARGGKLSLRLRSNSGLSLHTNEDALRQYTDYNPDGSPRSPVFGPVVWQPREGIDAVTGGGLSVLGGMPAGYRRSMLPEYGPVGTLSIPDFFGQDVFQMVLSNPTTAHRLWKFAQSQGCGENMEFLLKVQEYSSSANQLTTLLAGISTGFTSFTASTPIRLPGQMSKSLNTDIKHLTGSLLPGLDAVFLESRTCIEQRVARDVYPAFVKNQLALATTVSLAAEGAYSLEYPGLGDCFCLTDAVAADNPIGFASDGFVSVTGYARSDVIGRNCRFLQGPMTDRAAVSRMRETVSRGGEAVELVLNYREDGTPFWNLLYICPLADASGRVKYYLGAQVNVSDSIGSHKDVLRVLNFGGAAAPLQEDSEKLSPMESPSIRRPNTAVVAPDREKDKDRGNKSGGETSLKSRSSIRSKSSRKTKSFFKFSRKSPPSSSTPAPSSTQNPDYPAVASATSSLESVNYQSLAQKLALSSPPESLYTAYSRFIVLRHVPGPKSARLVINFASRSALEILNLGLAADAILQKDVFNVLAEQANCPSVTRGFKSSIRDTVLGEGMTATMELLVAGAPSTRRKASVIALGGGGGGGGEERTQRSRGQKHVRLVSYWTPVKDGEGEVAWVVLTVAPRLVEEWGMHQGLGRMGNISIKSALGGGGEGRRPF